MFCSRKRSPPLSSYTAHFYVYYWVYSQEFSHTCATMELVENMFDDDRDNIFICAENILACNEEFSLHFAHTACRLLMDDRIIDSLAHNLLALVTVFVRASPETFCAPSIVEGVGLLPYLMLSCRRHICSSVPHEAFTFVIMTIDVLLYVCSYYPALSLALNEASSLQQSNTGVGERRTHSHPLYR